MQRRRQRRHHRHEIDDLATLEQHLAAGRSLAGWVVQQLDLAQLDGAALEGLERIDLADSLWLGCRFASDEQAEALRGRGALLFPPFADLPYAPYRRQLYAVDELMAGHDEAGYTGTKDFAIYAHAHRARCRAGGIDIREALAQRLHDHAIDDALAEFLDRHRGRGVVGIMGGHRLARSAPAYRQVVELGWRLAREGYLVVTGGGPGAMEAGNLGAWLSRGPATARDEAVDLLATAETVGGGHAEGSPAFFEAVAEYIDRGRDVVARFQSLEPGVSLAIPTWFYGHEPTNLFCTAIAKYFDNSIREEGLLAIADAGVVYAPGGAGTMQEIFQDLCQNHYGSYGVRSPMVLLGRTRYQAEYELLQRFIALKNREEVYGDLVALVDTAEEAAAFILAHPPRPAQVAPPLYDDGV